MEFSYLYQFTFCNLQNVNYILAIIYILLWQTMKKAAPEYSLLFNLLVINIYKKHPPRPPFAPLRASSSKGE